MRLFKPENNNGLNDELQKMVGKIDDDIDNDKERKSWGSPQSNNEEQKKQGKSFDIMRKSHIQGFKIGESQDEDEKEEEQLNIQNLIET